MILDPEQDWLPSHGVLDGRALASFPLIGLVEDPPKPFVRPFTLAQHFTRGGYPGSLHAGSAPRARQWREQWLRDGLPLLPLDQRDSIIDPSLFWPLLAGRFGTGETAPWLQIFSDGASTCRASMVGMKSAGRGS